MGLLKGVWPVRDLLGNIWGLRGARLGRLRGRGVVGWGVGMKMSILPIGTPVVVAIKGKLWLTKTF